MTYSDATHLKKGNLIRNIYIYNLLGYWRAAVDAGAPLLDDGVLDQAGPEPASLDRMTEGTMDILENNLML